MARSTPPSPVWRCSGWLSVQQKAPDLEIDVSVADQSHRRGVMAANLVKINMAGMAFQITVPALDIALASSKSMNSELCLFEKKKKKKGT